MASQRASPESVVFSRNSPSFASAPTASVAMASASAADPATGCACSPATMRPSGAYPVPVSRTSPLGVTIRSTVISLRVNVPVLSEQITDAEPSVSTEWSFLTIAWCIAMRCTPKASTTVRIAANPSGTAATASDTASSSESMTSCTSWNPSVMASAASTITAMAHTAMPRILETWFISFCSGLSSSSVACSRSAILPTWVPMPVLVTMARPVPWVTDVPLNTMLARSPRALAWTSVSVFLPTGTLSPVRLASATRRLAAANRRPSADMESPSPSTMTSPGTTSVVLMRSMAPSRTTLVCGAVIWESASTAASAFDSWM